jgi:hypothetical protein
MAMLTMDHGLRFAFEALTDLALLPSLAIVAERGRHFELFVGAFQLVCSLGYNITDALEISLLLSPREWHQLTNVLTISYGLHLFVYLMGNRSEERDHLLRYLAFASVWVAQIRDGYWMETTHYTLYVALAFMLLPVAHMLFGKHIPYFDRPKVIYGFLALVVAGFFFYLGLDETHDPFRMFHGFSQVSGPTPWAMRGGI